MWTGLGPPATDLQADQRLGEERARGCWHDTMDEGEHEVVPKVCEQYREERRLQVRFRDLVHVSRT